MFKKLIHTKFLSAIFVVGLALMVFGTYDMRSIMSLSKIPPKSYNYYMKTPKPKHEGPMQSLPVPSPSAPEGYRKYGTPVPSAPNSTPTTSVPDLPNSCFILGKWFSFIGGISLVGKMVFGVFVFIYRKLKRKKDVPVEIPVNE